MKKRSVKPKNVKSKKSRKHFKTKSHNYAYLRRLAKKANKELKAEFKGAEYANAQVLKQNPKNLTKSQQKKNISKMRAMINGNGNTRVKIGAGKVRKSSLRDISSMIGKINDYRSKQLESYKDIPITYFPRNIKFGDVLKFQDLSGAKLMLGGESLSQKRMRDLTKIRSQKEFEDYFSKLKKQSASDYGSMMMEQYRANWLGAIYREYGNAEPELIEQISTISNKLTAEKFFGIMQLKYWGQYDIKNIYNAQDIRLFLTGLLGDLEKEDTD